MDSQDLDLTLVDPKNACPHCHERNIDRLIWDEDGVIVKCVTCGNEYDPNAIGGVNANA